MKLEHVVRDLLSGQKKVNDDNDAKRRAADAADLDLVMQIKSKIIDEKKQEAFKKGDESQKDPKKDGFVKLKKDDDDEPAEDKEVTGKKNDNNQQLSDKSGLGDQGDNGQKGTKSANTSSKVDASINNDKSDAEKDGGEGDGVTSDDKVKLGGKSQIDLDPKIDTNIQKDSKDGKQGKHKDSGKRRPVYTENVNEVEAKKAFSAYHSLKRKYKKNAKESIKTRLKAGKISKEQADKHLESASKIQEIEDKKPARHMSHAEIEKELEGTKPNGFGYKGGKDRYKALMWRKNEIKSFGETYDRDDNGIKQAEDGVNAFPNQPYHTDKDRSDWHLKQAKKSDKAGDKKTAGDHLALSSKFYKKHYAPPAPGAYVPLQTNTEAVVTEFSKEPWSAPEDPPKKKKSKYNQETPIPHEKIKKWMSMQRQFHSGLHAIAHGIRAEDENDFQYEDILDEEEFLDERSQGKIEHMSPEQHKHFRQADEEGKQWHHEHPVSHENIIHHYHQATAEEKHHGHTWYHDAHHMTKVIAHDTSTPVHTMAGLVSNYSPQTHWHTNIMTAAKVAREKKAVGGKGSGVFASSQQKEAAHKMLHGEHYEHVLKGHKTKAFAHLIEHGGNKDEHKPHVVVDRHAYSVAAGHRITDAAFGHAGLKSKKKYNEVSHAYHKAAEHLSAEHGIKIHPHQVQATTWLVRQRLNAEHNTKQAKAAGKAKEGWNKYAGEHHPHLIGHEPGTGYSHNVHEEADFLGEARYANMYDGRRSLFRKDKVRAWFKKKEYDKDPVKKGSGRVPVVGDTPAANPGSLNMSEMTDTDRKEKELGLKDVQKCSHCHGTGKVHSSGVMPRECKQCHGKGVMSEGWLQHGKHEFTATAGEKHKSSCPYCKTKLDYSKFESHTDNDGKVTHWKGRCSHPGCNTRMTVFNEEENMKTPKMSAAHKAGIRAYHFNGSGVDISHVKQHADKTYPGNEKSKSDFLAGYHRAKSGSVTEAKVGRPGGEPENIIMQLKKAKSLGHYQVKHADGSTRIVHRDEADRLLNSYASHQRSDEKDAFAKKVAKNVINKKKISLAGSARIGGTKPDWRMYRNKLAGT